MTFTQFAMEQMRPFGAMAAPYGVRYEEAREPICDCLIELSAVNRMAEKPKKSDWLKTQGGGRVAAVCAELSEAVEFPNLAAIRGVWNRMFPAVTNYCVECAPLSGYVIVERSDGTSGAAKCDHGQSVNTPNSASGPSRTN